MSPNVPASIKARLLNQARKTGEELELYLVRYACERFLYRLGASPLRDRYVLKGAALLALWVDDPYRATRDLDLLAFGASDAASIREVVETICGRECAEDGLTFDATSVEVTPIRAEDKYPGQRAVLWAYLGKARIRLQVDFGFGEGISPSAEDSEYPTMLAGLPAPRLRTYPQVVTLAEKLDAMVQLGRRNSRMKDFHDVWALSTEFAFDGRSLRHAIVDCFARRGTPWTPEAPEALGSAFYRDDDLQARWGAYLRAGAFRAPPPARFESIGERVRSFLGPVRESIVADEPFELEWRAGGPWRQSAGLGGEDE
jgi:predicted nucleotidyltransferase component of viral defense system